MSELADREQATRRGWARPGRAHDRLISILKIALPAAIGLVLAFLALSPLEDDQEVSFLLDKNKVDTAEERMRIDSAQYRGQDEMGRPFVITARAAVQPSSAQPIVHIVDMLARLLFDNGPAQLRAERARYNLEAQQVDVLGPILFTAPDGYRLTTRDVTVDLNRQQMRSTGAVQGELPLGTFSAGAMAVDLPERRVVLSQGARLHIRQGAVR